MVKAAGEKRREPDASLVLPLVELDRQIDVANLEGATREGTEDADLTDAREVPAIGLDDSLEERRDALRRFRPLHASRLVSSERGCYGSAEPPGGTPS